MNGAEYQNFMDRLGRMERSLEEIAENTRHPEPTELEADPEVGETELKPCPFCGGEGVIWEAGEPWIVTCKGCWVQTDPVPDRQQAIAAWNRRPAPAPPAVDADEPTTWDALVDLEEQIARVIDRVHALENGRVRHLSAAIHTHLSGFADRLAALEARLRTLEQIAGYGKPWTQDELDRGKGEAERLSNFIRETYPEQWRQANPDAAPAGEPGRGERSGEGEG